MRVTINGTDHELPAGATVAQAVRALTERTTGVAVAVNDEVIARGAWDSTPLAEADRVEVLTAVQGG
ncbi:thiamine biosynthesis protein ThiS [Thermopolyspora flexuosa]|jgi:sulfur carrier protein|uniref:Sulfur carrier protein ThiS n=1 Tax=Thermopolyspora flexuosa TaxID=103836 RepID=A0A543IZU3_9ACTN|nr:sulfur carrier protein ThiS [Thermopolyspora flexuosa]TQM76090.1 sulfur carrier protein ThiS [Thermopolyspora flexuosa]GGM64607.1 thiamine biosynthesis protein ThiS [Thermopolyspora flexuosa]